MKSPLLKNIIVLGSICIFFSILLGVVNHFTEPVILKNKTEKKMKALSSLISGGTVGDEKSVEGETGILAEYPVSEGEKVAGYILFLSGSGYGGPMTALAYYDLNGTIINAVLMDNSETPGKADSPVYMKKFMGTGGPTPVPTKKSQLSPEYADGLSGATISFNGISGMLKRGSDYITAKQGMEK